MYKQASKVWTQIAIIRHKMLTTGQNKLFYITDTVKIKG